MATLTALVAAHGIRRLRRYYTDAWQRLVAGRGPFALTPFAGVRATITRWDLLTLWRLEQHRRRADAAPLLCIVEPNVGAQKNGYLVKELGLLGSPHPPPQSWSSPHVALSGHLATACELLPNPPPLVWMAEATTTQPRDPSDSELELLHTWYQSIGKRRKRGGPQSALSAEGGTAVACASAPRKRQSVERLVAEE